MSKNEVYLGIDTSCYTTSVALIGREGGLVGEARRILQVKPGCRGLQQSEMVFQHTRNLPILLEEVLKKPLKGIGIGVVSILTIMFLLAMTLKGKSALKAGLALIFGGGLANLLERFRHGYVTDYVQFKVPIPFLKKLIFNIADFCVFIGMAVLMLREIGKQC